MKTLDCGHVPATGPEHVYNGQPAWTFVLDFDGKRKICHACADARVLDCGHTPSSHGPMTTGYGEDASGRRRCYECCADADKASMIADGRATLYVSLKQGNRAVTNWPRSLSFPCLAFGVSPRAGGFGSQRTDAWFIGPDGYIWHAVNRGDNDIARCKRTKLMRWSGVQYLRSKGRAVTCA